MPDNSKIARYVRANKLTQNEIDALAEWWTFAYEAHQYNAEADAFVAGYRAGYRNGMEDA